MVPITWKAGWLSEYILADWELRVYRVKCLAPSCKDSCAVCSTVSAQTAPPRRPESSSRYRTVCVPRAKCHYTDKYVATYRGNGTSHTSDFFRVASGIKGGYTRVTLPRIVTPYRDSVDGTRDRVTHRKLVTR
jgi:hypothetical protein